MSRTIVAFVAAGLFVMFGQAVVYSQDDLNRILERDKLTAQKLKSEANDALAQSRIFERSDPDRAMEQLLDVTAKIRNSTELPAEERARLLERLQARSRDLIAAAQAKKNADAENAARRAQEKSKQEVRETNTKSKPPLDGPASVASKYFEQRNAQVAAANKQKSESAERNLNSLTSLQKSATQIEGDIQFSKDWARISERGKQKLTEKEIAMLRALNSTLSVNFDRKPFSDVINELQDKASLSILIDESSAKEANLDYNDPVSLKVNKATLRIVLQKVLKDRGLTYVLKDGLVQVVTLEKARQMMVVRTYPVQDLVAANDPLFWGPVFSRAIMLQNAQRIVDMITTSVEPSQWGPNGNGGSVTFNEATMSIVVRASAEMHYMLGSSGMTSR